MSEVILSILIITTIPHYFRIRILSHTDPIRCDDSFAAFEEILQTAKSKQADFILLAGDLFHENKPSRRTLHSTIELLRLYCLGSDPVYIEILNDQSEIFKNTFGRANYEDPYQSVSLPIFSIHGNHDDPSREGCNYKLILDLYMFLYVWMTTINTCRRTRKFIGRFRFAVGEQSNQLLWKSRQCGGH